MNNRQLVEVIMIAVKKAVKEEMKTFKQQLLNEIKGGSTLEIDGSRLSTTVKKSSNNSLTEVQKNFRQQYQVKRPNVQYSQDPMLNEILASCEPMSEKELNDNPINELLDKVNLPVDTNGMPLKIVPSNVLEAMNRDYSGMFSKKTEQKTQSKPVNENLRSAILGRMEDDTMSNNNTSTAQQSFDDDEDFSFLDRVG